jgi:hypothetical protein
MENAPFEDIRNRYLPSRVKVLFIGESPPIGGAFFFLGKSILFKSTKEVFEEFYIKLFPDPFDFLNFFKNSGYFLDDLCHKPINHIKDPIVREKLRSKSIEGLSDRLKDYNPRRIISVMKNPQFNMCVDEAINNSAIDISIKYAPLPFPRYERNVISYKLNLKQYLTDLNDRRIITNSK